MVSARQLEISSLTENKYFRASWNGEARLEINFYAKPGGKAQIAVQVNRLAKKSDVERERAVVEEGARETSNLLDVLMQLHLSSWPEIEAYLKTSKAILIPIGSTEQHGPNGLIGTDCICPETSRRRAGDEEGFLVGPTFNVGQAQHHMAFPARSRCGPPP